MSEQVKFIDFFSGCGGLSLGLGMAGWDGVFAIEKDPMAFRSFKRNLVDEDAPFGHFDLWPSWLSKEPHSIENVLDSTDIVEHLKSLKGEVDLVAGGPPCQGFSVAGARNGNDPRNLLVFKQIQAIDILRPHYVIIENVGGFEKKFVNRPSDNTTISIAEEAMTELKKIGYNVGKVIVNAADFGVPQLRKRVILFGAEKDYVGDVCVEDLLRDVLHEVGILQRQELSLPIDRYVTVGEALSDLAGGEVVEEPEFPGFNTCKYLPVQSQYQALMRKGFENRQIPSSHRFNRHGERVVDLYRKAIATQPAGRLSKEFLFENGCHSNKRYVLNVDQPCSTVTTAPEEIIHYKSARCVTLREMARIQSFPDAFVFCGRYTLNGPARGIDVPRNAQIGNAIPPLVGRALGKALRKIDQMVLSGDTALDEYRFQLDLKSQ